MQLVGSGEGRLEGRRSAGAPAGQRADENQAKADAAKPRRAPEPCANTMGTLRESHIIPLAAFPGATFVP